MSESAREMDPRSARKKDPFLAPEGVVPSANRRGPRAPRSALTSDEAARAGGLGEGARPLKLSVEAQQPPFAP
jgi:hypothetical protein